MANSLISDWFIQVFSTPKPIEILNPYVISSKNQYYPVVLEKNPQ